MWSCRSEEEGPGGRQRRYTLHCEGPPVAFADVLTLWQSDPGFLDFFGGLLAAAPCAAYRWETPPLTAATTTRPFEFVLVDDSRLDTGPEPKAFASHFADGGSAAMVSVFANLGGDATLVVPRPLAAASAYGHLAAFVRHAPHAQVHALWQAVSEAMWRWLSAKPVWLSTAGGGVAWLHVRLDDRPKYYSHAPYRHAVVS